VSSVSAGCNTNDCYGYPKTKGFSRKWPNQNHPNGYRDFWAGL
jgi:hypothetical protein